MKKFFSIISLLICCCLVFTACKSKNATDLSSGTPDTSITTADTKNMDFSIDEDDTDTSYDGSSATKISLSDTGTTTVSGSGVKTDSSNGLISGCADITITAAGTYLLSGEKSDVMVIVNAENKEVHIVLSGVTIKNSKGPAIYVKSAKKVTITLQDGTTNTISDGSSYSVSDSNSTLDAAIFSKADLTINGNGTLTLKGNYKHGIVSKDDLIITSGTFNITSKKVGISGKDCVKISGGNITVNAGSDGIRSDNTDDASKGYIYISGGTINITAGNDGIQAETVLKIENANLTVKSGGGSSDSLTSSSESYKGLKAGSDIYISGGSINIDSKDDSIHSNGTITISEGKFSLSSGDDGIHADTDIAISGGNINISKCYEGIEGSKIVITGGTISLTASDDGLNASGGNDSSAMGNRPGQGFFTSSNGSIVISGGYTYINSKGDGIDSNGSLSVSGGITLVDGPTDNGNGALDYDASAEFSGGILIATGSAGMAQNATACENQASFLCGLGSQSANQSLAVCDSNGKVVVSFTPTKSYQCAVVTAPEIKSGSSYSVVIGGNVSSADSHGFAKNTTVSGGTTITTFTLSSSVSTVNGSGSFGNSGGAPGGNMGGNMRGEQRNMPGNKMQ